MITRIFKSVGAVVAGIITIFALSHVTDFALERPGLMKIPFNENPLWLMIIVTVYRSIYVVAGAYLTALLAPRYPMRHAIILGCIGIGLGILGAIAMWHEPPHWFPLLLIVLALPTAWLGGKLQQKTGR